MEILGLEETLSDILYRLDIERINEEEILKLSTKIAQLVLSEGGELTWNEGFLAMLTAVGFVYYIGGFEPCERSRVFAKAKKALRLLERDKTSIEDINKEKVTKTLAKVQKVFRELKVKEVLLILTQILSLLGEEFEKSFEKGGN